LEEYLGDFYQKLLDISLSLDYNFYFEDDVQKINWKLIVENVIEAYHCPAIHQNTLFNMGFCRISEVDNHYFNGHSVADYPKSENINNNDKLLKYLDNIEFKHASFRHYFIFPNLLISSTEGSSIYVGNILPDTSEKSILRKRFYSPKFANDFTPKESIHKAFLEMVKTSINQILEEDKVILEQIQLNLSFVDKTYFLGNEEKRINMFHEKYLELI
jgi:phenylpropionate dioxygenase-like ring-hydroxylating dioxygenase large terminal subunit